MLVAYLHSNFNCSLLKLLHMHVIEKISLLKLRHNFCLFNFSSTFRLSSISTFDKQQQKQNIHALVARTTINFPHFFSLNFKFSYHKTSCVTFFVFFFFHFRPTLTETRKSRRNSHQKTSQTKIISNWNYSFSSFSVILTMIFDRYEKNDN